jgi:hypothetical protein
MSKKGSFLIFATVCLALLLPSMFALAQDGLDSSENPNYGTYDVSLYPDPLITTMLSGGDVSVGDLDIGEGCTGNVTSNPDFKVELSDSANNLRIFYVTDQGDTTLIVELPGGDYACNDDASDLNPLLDLSNAESGTYSIWVGSFSAQDFIPGYLVVTTGDSAPGALVSSLLGSAAGSSTPPSTPDVPVTETPTPTGTGDDSGLNVEGEPNYGSSELESGFSPDPVEVDISSGGSVDVTALSLSADCRGFVANNPDHRIEWSGSGSLLRVFFVSDGDTTLVVGTPSGDYLCNDDFDGLDPLVDIEDPEEGSYNVWVGTFGSDDVIPGTLYITSDDSIDPNTVK